MIAPLMQMAVLVAMTHGFRVAGRWVGPRRGGLLTGLPSTTALVLVGCGLERGVDEAVVAAEACLVGLVAAAALFPLAYAEGGGGGLAVPRGGGGGRRGLRGDRGRLVVGAEARRGGVCRAWPRAGVAAACHLAGQVRVAPVGAGRPGPLSIGRAGSPVGRRSRPAIS